MNKIRYADAGMDVRKLLLRFLQKIWIVGAATVLGALIAAGIYTVVRTVPEEEREYRAVAKLYLDFAADETGEVYKAGDQVTVTASHKFLIYQNSIPTGKRATDLHF